MRVTDTGSASWILRATVAGKRSDIGLGSYRDVSLATARDQARTMREEIRLGNDPVQARKHALAEQRAARAKSVTFDEVAKLAHAAKQSEFRNSKWKKDWLSAVTRFASPVIGKVPANKIELRHMLQVLEPIWHEKTETASRLRGRLEAILDYATVAGYRTGDNPARWKGNLQWKDALWGCRNMTPTEFGAYVWLLHEQLDKGSLPTDLSKLARIARVEAELFPDMWQLVIAEKFHEHDGTYYNMPMLREFIAQAESVLGHRQRASRGGKASAKAKQADAASGSDDKPF